MGEEGESREEGAISEDWGEGTTSVVTQSIH